MKFLVELPALPTLDADPRLCTDTGNKTHDKCSSACDLVLKWAGKLLDAQFASMADLSAFLAKKGVDTLPAKSVIAAMASQAKSAHNEHIASNNDRRPLQVEQKRKLSEVAKVRPANSGKKKSCRKSCTKHPQPASDDQSATPADSKPHKVGHAMTFLTVNVESRSVKR